VANVSGSLLAELGRASSGSQAANVRRISTMDNMTVIVDVTVWDADDGSAIAPAQEY
jgi:hypothetical protein